MGSKEADADGDIRQTFQEAMDLVELPTNSNIPGPVNAKRYMGTRAAWLPGRDLGELNTHNAAYGGHVYAQAALAMCRAQAEAEKVKGTKLGLHTIHGYFTTPGQLDRPFIYTVTPLTSGRTFSTTSVTAYQPSKPSTNPARDRFPIQDASLPLAHQPSFTAIASFKSSAPHTGGGTISSSEPPVQSRFKSILSSRPPEAWPPSPPVDIDVLVDVVGRDLVGTFPAVEMRKVDMASYNARLPLHEQRELILYRLLAPLPVGDGGSGGGGGGRWDANAHVCVHAFTIDRNGLLMLGNSLGLGGNPFRAASLSYSLVVHVNAEEAVMEGPGWWVQECCFPRAGAGRGVVMSKVWSPAGVHVATEYQDGLCEAFEGRGKMRAPKL